MPTCPHDTDGDGDCHLCFPGPGFIAPCPHMPRKITNTQTAARRAAEAGPLGFGLAAVMMGTSGSIEASEAQGQRELVESTQLPVKMPPKDRAWLESKGVVFSKEYSQGDPLFFDVTLPVGWKKKATDHSMWSELYDEKGVKVASIFYKAAFYDRDAFLDVIYPK